MSERRKINRSELKGLINYYGTQKADSVNISKNGICIICTQALQKGTPIFIKIPDKKNKALHRFGLITRCVPQENKTYKIGIKFIKKEASCLQQLKEQQRSQDEAEQRSSQRYSSKQIVYYSPLMNGMMKNYNDTGLCLYTTHDFKINQQIHLLKPISSKNQIMIKGVVVWHKTNVSGLKQSGIRFKQVKVIQKTKLMNFFSKSIIQSKNS